jgi:hypothetical protein
MTGSNGSPPLLQQVRARMGAHLQEQAARLGIETLANTFRACLWAVDEGESPLVNQLEAPPLAAGSPTRVNAFPAPLGASRTLRGKAPPIRMSGNRRAGVLTSVEFSGRQGPVALASRSPTA